MLERIKPNAGLVKEMLDKLPAEMWSSKTTTFLDPAVAGGQFVAEIEKRLKAHGHSDKNISKRVFGYERSQFLVNLAVHMHRLVGQYTVKSYEEYLEMTTDTKFDWVGGNPPFTDAAGQNTLYPKFYSKGVELVKQDGHISMITPTAIIPGLWGLKDPDGIKMPEPITINKIAIGEQVKKHFPDVGSDFCYFVLQNTPSNNSQVTVETDHGTIVANGPLFPQAVKSESDLKIAQSIINKSFKFNNDHYSASTSDHGKSAHHDPKGKDLAIETIGSDGTVKTRSVTWDKDHAHYNSPKVVMPLYGKVSHIDYTHKLVSAGQEVTANGKLTGHNVCTVLTNSDAESESLVSILESRLQRFFGQVIGETRSPYVIFLKHFVGVPLNQKYTDDTLETLLGLTQKEKKWLDTV